MKWINLLVLSLSILFGAPAIEAKASSGDPPTAGGEPYQPPIWVPDFQTPGFWENFFGTCKVCSEG